MKFFLLIFLMIPMQLSCADNSKQDSIQNKTIILFASTFNGQAINNPVNWLRFYEHENTSIENRIYITSVFDVKNISALVISDVNAENLVCGAKQKKFLLYLAFEPMTRVKRLTTRIPKPCFNNNKATFKVNIKTHNGQRFHNTVTLTAHPNAFNPVSN